MVTISKKLSYNMAEIASRTTASRVAEEERDIRVEDYLNDKLQNSTDLANIDALLEDVKAQQILLQQQVGISSFYQHHRRS